MRNVDPNTYQHLPIILSDAGDTLISGIADIQKPLGEKLMELKRNSDVYMITDSTESSAKSMLLNFRLNRPTAITFTGVITRETFGVFKDEDAYWGYLFAKFGKTGEHFIAIDDNDAVLAAAERNNVTTVKATRDSADNAARLGEAYKKVIAQLNM